MKCKHQVYCRKEKRWRSCKKVPIGDFCKLHTPKEAKQLKVEELTEAFGKLEIPEDEKWSDATAAATGSYSLTLLSLDDDRCKFIEKYLRDNFSEDFLPTRHTIKLLQAELRQHPAELYSYTHGRKLFNFLGKPTEELWGFHGVQNHALIPVINEQGIKAQANVLNHYCTGAYLSVRAEFSTARNFCARFTQKRGKFVPDTNGNIHHIYMCKFYTGRYSIGSKDARLPPLLPKSTTERYDSVTNNLKYPALFSLPDIEIGTRCTQKVDIRFSSHSFCQ